MSDAEFKVECGSHGQQTGTFICQHLTGGSKGRGFNVGYSADEPDDLYPDAWCDACEDMLKNTGDWTDEALTFANIKLVCASCYMGESCT